jgi:hypothetical protein
MGYQHRVLKAGGERGRRGDIQHGRNEEEWVGGEGDLGPLWEDRERRGGGGWVIEEQRRHVSCVGGDGNRTHNVQVRRLAP